VTGSVVQLEHARADQAYEARAAELAARYADAPAQEIIRVAIEEEFGGRITLVSSFGTESAVLLHLAGQVAPDVPVVFLDTGKHFAQTLSYKRRLASQIGLTNVLDIKPDAVVLTEDDPSGDLWRRDADKCCTIRKVNPLHDALGNYDAWFTGRKQFHGGERVRLPVFEYVNGHFKVNPIVRWAPEDITAYFERHDLPRHPLQAQGFPSIGCWPCTHPVAEGDDVRAGRWRGQAKTECGIHGK
jgi:phosphoadenosine phosphosulfate reductase